MLSVRDHSPCPPARVPLKTLFVDFGDEGPPTEGRPRQIPSGLLHCTAPAGVFLAGSVSVVYIRTTALETGEDRGADSCKIAVAPTKNRKKVDAAVVNEGHREF